MSTISDKLYSLRQRAQLPQENVANALGVSAQAVQDWENGSATPAVDQLSALAKLFNVSPDYLASGSDTREINHPRADVPPLPSYDAQPSWEAYFKELSVEYAQCVDEGKDIEKYRELIFAASKLPNDRYKAAISDVIFNIVVNCPQKPDYPYVEPSDLDEILACCEQVGELPRPEKGDLADRMKGAWYGRICGCLLGKPVEGMKRRELIPFLRSTGNFPMHRYITKSDVADIPEDAYSFEIVKRAYEDGVMSGMPTDDDTNYIILAYLAVEKYGRDFTSKDMADIWLSLQPKQAYCTAERVAYRNFINGYLPPESARYKNPYREWIGAQIRGDFFGWINPGDPKKAAEMAFADAAVSHIKNGIYGEMWVAAALAAAGAGCSIERSVEIGLAYVPRKSRFHEAISNILAFYRSGISAEAAFADISSRWNDEDGHHWCHTISNAEIVAASLLYGEGDYGRSICMAVSQGFDTDCNGATVGSIIGMQKGFAALPREWTDKINGTLFTSIFGYEKLSVDKMADMSLRFVP